MLGWVLLHCLLLTARVKALCDKKEYSCDGVCVSYNDTCSGKCFKDKPEQNVDVRHHRLCGSGDQCALEWDLCQGRALCDDRSDTAWCRDEEWREWKANDNNG